MEPHKKLAILALALALMGGCAAKAAPAVAPCSPPVAYLQDVPEPILRGKTNKDLAEHVLDLREALRRSNLDKFHLREWAGEALTQP
jgi:type IV pilus biogenesis protein CpaD/CtpE